MDNYNKADVKHSEDIGGNSACADRSAEFELSITSPVMNALAIFRARWAEDSSLHMPGEEGVF